MPLHLPGKIWKIELDPPQAYLVLEVRETEPRRVSFWVISLRDEQTFTQLLHTTSDWWVSLAGAQQGMVLIQGHQDPGLPLPQGIWAYRIDQSQLVWEDPQRSFAHLIEGEILTRQATRPSLSESLDLHSGKVNALSQTEWTTKAAQAPPGSEALAFPRMIRVDDPLAAPYLSRLTSLQPGKPQAHLEVLDYQNYQATAWYTSQDGQHLDHWLAVWHQGQLHAHTQLALQTQQLALDSFMRCENWLIAYHADGSLSLGQMENQ